MNFQKILSSISPHISVELFNTTIYKIENKKHINIISIFRMATLAQFQSMMDAQVCYTNRFAPSLPKCKPNAKCPCGSGKKFKKCCKKKQVQRANMTPKAAYLTENPTALKTFQMEQMDFAPEDMVISMILRNRYDNKTNKTKINPASDWVSKQYLQEVEEWCGDAPVRMDAADPSLWGWENYCYTNAYSAAVKYNMEHPEDPNARVVMGLNITQLPDGVPSNTPGRRTSMETHAVVEINGELIDVTPDFDGLKWKWFVPIKGWTKGCYNSSGGFRDVSLHRLYKAYIGEITDYVEKFSGVRGFVYENNYKEMSIHSLEDWDFEDAKINADMERMGFRVFSSIDDAIDALGL